MPSGTGTSFGRYAVSEPMRFDRMHLFRGETLREVDHEPPCPVLDQEDLLSQGIDTAALVRGARRVDALGSCSCNAATVSLVERVADFGVATLEAGHLTLTLRDAAASARLGEEFAVCLYHRVTDQTGDPATEWPPTDCGSTGLYVCTELERLGMIASFRTAHDIPSLVSLLQAGTVIMGAPWFKSWMEPDSMGFVDAEGRVSDLEAAIASGVAGGHETCLAAVERLSFDGLGHVDCEKSHLRVRNSWGPAWGDHGSYRIHLSTLQMLGSHVDHKQFVVGA